MTASGQPHQVQYDPDGALRRVTILQLLRAMQDDPSYENRFTIDGIGFKTIVVVANVFSFEADGNRGRYGLDDGSGRISAFYQPPDGLELPEIRNFAYARVTGELAVFHGAWKSIKASVVEPVHDPYEVFHHILHTIVDTLTYERGLPTPTSTSQNQVSEGNETYTSTCGLSTLQSSHSQSQSTIVTPQDAPPKQKVDYKENKNPTKRHVEPASSASPEASSNLYGPRLSSRDSIVRTPPSSLSPSAGTYPRVKKADKKDPVLSLTEQVPSVISSYVSSM